MTVNIIVTNTISKIDGQLDKNVIRELSYELSYDVSGASFSPKVLQGYWDGRKKLFSVTTFSFATGLLHRATELLKLLNVPFTIVDQRVVPVLGTPIPSTLTLWDWQEDIIQNCLKEVRGIIKAPTGCGKGIIAIHFIARVNLPTIVLVNRRDIFYQLKRWFKKYLNIDVGVIGDSKVEPSQITLAMVQTIARTYHVKIEGFDEDDKTVLTTQKINTIKDCVNSTVCLVGDECHGLVAQTYYGLYKFFKNSYYRLGFSATPFKESGEDLLLEAAFGKKIVNFSCSDLIKKGFLAKPTFYLVRVRHQKVERTLDYQELYEQEIVQNEHRNFLITKIGTNFWKKGKKVLISVTQVKHGKILEAMFKAVLGEDKVCFIHGEVDTSLRQQTLEDLDKGNIRLVISTKVFAEGVDVRSLDVLMNVKAQISPIDFVQTIGRAMRKTETKDKVCIVDIYDYGCRFLEKHSKSRLTILRKEPEFKLYFIDESKI